MPTQYTASHFINSHLVKVQIDNVGNDKVGIDKVGIYEVRIEEVRIKHVFNILIDVNNFSCGCFQALPPPTLFWRKESGNESRETPTLDWLTH